MISRRQLRAIGRIFFVVVSGGFLEVGSPRVARAEDTWAYAVQVSADMQTSPPQIKLHWRPDPHTATNYVVYRKLKEETSWGAGVVLPGTATNFTDTNVVVGGAYEYQITKATLPGYRGFGYIFAGIEAPLTESRGKIVLVVDASHAASLASELNRLMADLEGDGWIVIRHDVSSADSPQSVRNLIINDYNSDPATVNAVFLFGHIPVLHSGNLDYDGHLARPMPADAFYGDMFGDWSGSPDYLPADVQLIVGRVDFFDMPGNGAPVPWPSEVELLRNYLNKDHRWRHKQITVPRRALMGNRRGDELGEATAASGYRNFEPLVGPGNTIEANVEDISSDEVRWGPMLAADSYLWAFGCAGGMPDGISHLGTVGEYHSLFSTNVVADDAKAVFVMLFGSWFANWDGTDNFMRAFLATPSVGLTCCMAGRPHWFLHHMGLGETIGYGTRLTMNNTTLYQNDSNGYPRAVYISLMGDPTLRMDMVSPPANLVAMVNGDNVHLDWTASGETVLGYNIYRRTATDSAFVRLNNSLVSGTNFTDTNPLEDCAYMVRAVKLQTTPSGSYFNASQGIFAHITNSIHVTANIATNGVLLTWNSQSGTVYRVLARDAPDVGNWSEISGDISGMANTTSWTDTQAFVHLARFYRIFAP